MKCSIMNLKIYCVYFITKKKVYTILCMRKSAHQKLLIKSIVNTGYGLYSKVTPHTRTALFELPIECTQCFGSRQKFFPKKNKKSFSDKLKKRKKNKKEKNFEQNEKKKLLTFFFYPQLDLVQEKFSRTSAPPIGRAQCFWSKRIACPWPVGGGRGALL